MTSIEATRLPCSVLLIALVKVGLGCADSVAPSSSEVTEIALEDYLTEFMRASWERARACCTEAEFRLFAGEDELQGIYEAPSQWRELVDAGMLAYDPRAAGVQVASFGRMTCAAFAALLGEKSQGDQSFLNAPFEGLVADEAACDRDLACASRYCAYDAAGDQACAAKPSEGAGCTSGCAEGLYCPAQSGPVTVGAGAPATPTAFCTAMKADGADCLESVECASAGCAGADPATGDPGKKCGAPTRCDGT